LRIEWATAIAAFALDRPRGKVNLIGLLMMMGIATSIYLGILLWQPIVDNFDVREHISAAYTQAGTLDDEGIRHLIEARTSRMGDHIEEGSDGTVRTLPGLGLVDNDITVLRDEVTHTILIRVDYTRKMELVPTHRLWSFKFHPQTAGPLH
jgi:hypothetical protein